MCFLVSIQLSKQFKLYVKSPNFFKNMDQAKVPILIFIFLYPSPLFPQLLIPPFLSFLFFFPPSLSCLCHCWKSTTRSSAGLMRQLVLHYSGQDHKMEELATWVATVEENIGHKEFQSNSLLWPNPPPSTVVSSPPARGDILS